MGKYNKFRKKLTSETHSEYMLAKLIANSVKDDATGCLIWQGSKSNGYGYMVSSDKKTTRPIQKLAYEIEHRTTLLPLTTVEQTCGNKLCIEPTHLYIKIEHREGGMTADRRTLYRTLEEKAIQLDRQCNEAVINDRDDSVILSELRAVHEKMEQEFPEMAKLNHVEPRKVTEREPGRYHGLF